MAASHLARHVSIDRGASARGGSPTLVPSDFDLEAWRRAAAWAASEPPGALADAARARARSEVPSGEITPMHLRVAELLVAHQLQQERVDGLERTVRRLTVALLGALVLAGGAGTLALGAGILALVR